MGLALWAATADLTANHQIFTLNNLLGQQSSIRMGSIMSGNVSDCFVDMRALCNHVSAVTCSIHMLLTCCMCCNSLRHHNGHPAAGRAQEFSCGRRHARGLAAVRCVLGVRVPISHWRQRKQSGPRLRGAFHMGSPCVCTVKCGTCQSTNVHLCIGAAGHAHSRHIRPVHRPHKVGLWMAPVLRTTTELSKH